MGGSSGSNNTTQTTRLEIPQWLEGNLQQIAGASKSLWEGGIGPEYFPDQTFAQYNPTQQWAFDRTLQTAGTDILSPAAADTLYGVMDRQGVTDPSWGALQPIRDIASGQNRIATGGAYEGLLGQIGGGNPYFDQLLEDQAQRTRDDVNATFTNAGRYGSGAHAGVLTDRIGEMRTRALQSQYNQDIAAQMAALQGLSTVQGTNVQNQLASGVNLSNFFQKAQADAMAAAGAAPGIAAAQYAPIQAAAGVGDAYMRMQQQAISDAVARWEFQNQQPWNMLSMYSGALQGLNPSKTQTSVTSAPGPTLVQSVLGPAATGAAIGNMIMPGVGTALGAAAGGIFGLAGR